MESSGLQKIIVVLLVIGTLGYFGYTVLVRDPSDATQGGSATSTASSVSAPSVGQDILSLVDKLKQAKIDPTLFTSTSFTSLQDTSVPIVPEPKGRDNPFAPIGTDGSYVASVTLASSTVATTSRSTRR